MRSEYENYINPNTTKKDLDEIMSKQTLNDLHLGFSSNITQIRFQSLINKAETITKLHVDCCLFNPFNQTLCVENLMDLLRICSENLKELYLDEFGVAIILTSDNFKQILDICKNLEKIKVFGSIYCGKLLFTKFDAIDMVKKYPKITTIDIVIF